MKKNWYKGVTATAITLAMAGAAFTVPALASDSIDGSAAESDTDVSVSVNENLPDIYQPGGVLEDKVEYTDGDVTYIAPEDQSEGVTVQPGDPESLGKGSVGEEEGTGEEGAGEEEGTGEEGTGEEGTGEEGAGEGEGDGEETVVVPGGSDGGVTVDGGDDGNIDENIDWSCFYDSQTGRYRLTYTIEEDTEDEILNIDLTYALKLLNQYAEDNQLNVDTLQPGDGLVYDIYITSNSGHTYKYLDGSFVLQTPDFSTEETGNQEEIAFDGQQITEDYLQKQEITIPAVCKPIKDFLLNNDLITEIEYNQNLIRTFEGDKAQKILSIFEEQYGTGLTFSQYVEQYLIDYYGGDYKDINDLLLNNSTAMKELYGTNSNGGARPFEIQLTSKDELQRVKYSIAPTLNYNNFYENLLSFVFGNGPMSRFSAS